MLTAGSVACVANSHSAALVLPFFGKYLPPGSKPGVLEKGFFMKLGPSFASATLIIALTTGGALAKPMSEAELRKAVIGKTVVLRTDGVDVPIVYRGNGTMRGRLKAFAAAFAGPAKASDSGKWWIANNQLCQRWNKWLDGKSYCYTLTLKGKQVQWRRNDGRSGTARIAG